MYVDLSGSYDVDFKNIAKTLQNTETNSEEQE